MEDDTTAQKKGRTEHAIKLMTDFANQTGLMGMGGDVNRRYLWTDAFAVATFFRLARLTGDMTYRQLALRLINQVHRTLGHFAFDDARKGWISGLSDAEGQNHPTAGGLRIGKAMLERKPEEPFDDRLEWERDGQYFHYLTQWVYSLFQAHEEMGETKFALWAAELTQVAIKHFVVHGKSFIKMYWKMSVDLSRPLVPHMGAHDPLEGFICAKMSEQRVSADKVNLEKSLRDMAELCRGRDWPTVDPLGIGGLLLCATRIAKLPEGIELPEEIQLEKLLLDIHTSLREYSQSPDFYSPAEYRLAFRECGLSLGLRSLSSIRHYTTNKKNLDILHSLETFTPLADKIEEFWCHPRKSAIINLD